MWQKFKTKCKEFFTNRAAVVVMVIILVTLTVILSVTFAMNRAKKTDNPPEEQNTTPTPTPTPDDTKANVDGTGEVPIYKENPDDGDKKQDEVKSTGYSLPVSGTLSKGHDAGIQVWSSTMGEYRVHLGIDIAAEEDAPVYAAADGVVTKIWNDPLMGVCVALEHDNQVCTIYKNMNAKLASGISEGKSVKGGQQIGCIGESANIELAEEPHLHFEMTANGLSVDPMEYFSREDVKTLETDTAYEDQTTAVGTDKNGK